ASVVPRSLFGGGLLDAGCHCRTTALGTVSAGSTRGGRLCGRRCLTRRPPPVSAATELPALLGCALSARNRLARRTISRPQTRAARRRIGGRAGAADPAGALPGQHDR